jgi:uracil-DNA glycosylase family 4
MTDWKSLIDTETASLLVKLARCQKELGFDNIILDSENIRKRRTELALREHRTRRAVCYESLEAHEKAICGCQKCPLGKTRTNLVYGVGNPHAGVMFIGEAPGRDEDLRGEPFVGRAGQLLDRILAAINFRREDVYIANILKCRPPNNRDPQADEMETCLPYLQEQIRLIGPRIICALGRIAAQALLNTTTPIGKLRKHWHAYQGIPFLVTYHPAALLRFQSYKKECWEDVQLLRARYDQIITEK